jgi:tRNA (mo5U34)-methyltransferase
MKRMDESMKQEIASVNWYHTLDLNGVTIPGIFNMSKYVNHYGIPTSLEGQSALDVGTASGFFAFEMERRGASPVVATDLERWEDHDFSARYQIDEKGKTESQNMLTRAFEIAKKYKQSKVNREIAGVYELRNKLARRFDLVICANVLLHLQNPYLALQNICRVTAGMAIVATQVYEAKFRKSRPILVYLNKPHLWFALTPHCMELISLQAGFSKCQYLGSHVQEPENGAWKDKVGVWHLYP